jgi:hypothetical protein
MARVAAQWFLRTFLFVLLAGTDLFALSLTITTGDQHTWSIGRVDLPLEATGGSTPYTWSAPSCSVPGVTLRTDVPPWFPPGVSAGLIGVANTAGTYSCTVRVTDTGNFTADKTLNIQVHTLVVTSNWELPDGSVGVAYSQAITATGGAGTLTFALQVGSPFPPGLTLALNGQISGTPSAEGTYEFDYTVTDGTSTIGRHGRIYISKLNITAPVQLPIGTQGAPYNQTILVSGGTASYTFSWGCCRPGELTFSSSGVISGTPSGPGYWQLQVTVTDSAGAWARRNFALGVVGTPLTLPSIDTISLEDITVGEQSGYSVFVSGGKPPYTWTVSSGSLPPGVGILNPSANPPWWANTALTLMGAPTAAGSYTFTLTATDSSSPAQSTSRSYTWRVSPLLTEGLPDATFGLAYDQKVRVLGGPPPYTVSVYQGLSPYGLTMSSSGQVTGTPQETGWFWFRVKANGAAGEIIRGNGINVVTSPASNVWINEGNWLGDILVNQPWSRTLSAGGGTGSYTWTLVSGPGSLPPGMTFTGSMLSGTPTTLGNYTFLIKAADASNPNNFAQRAFQIQVTPVQITTSPQLPWTNAGSFYSQTLPATGGTGTITWSLQPGSALPPGLTLSSGGVLSGTLSFTGQFNFNLVATDSGTGRSMNMGFSLAVYPAGQAPPLWINTGDQQWSIGRVEASLDATGGTGTYTWSLTSCNIPGISLRTDVPQGWTAQAGLLGVATTPGNYTCGVQVTSLAQTATKTFTVKVFGHVLTSNWEFPDGSVGVSYSQQITTAGATGTVSFNLAPGALLPPGLSLDTATGVISGPPTTAGQYDFQVNVTDSTGTFGRGMRIYISPMRITSPATLPNATQNTAYSQTITVAGGTASYTFSMSCCSPVSCCTPSWLSLNSTTGVLSGTPTGPGYSGIPVVITDSTGAQLRKHYTVGVVGTPLTAPSLSTTIEDRIIGAYEAWTIGISGGTAPYAFSVLSGSLPPGLSLQAPTDLPPYWTNSGVWLAGTPTAVGVYTFAVQATDSSAPPQTTGRQFTVRVSALSHEGLPDGILNVPYSKRLRVLGGTQPYTYNIVQGALPNGLTMDASGQVTGTPTETRWCAWFLLRVTDVAVAGNSLTRGNCIRINGPSPAPVEINDGSDLGNVNPNQSYSRTFSASGGTGSYTWTATGLPAWLSLSSAGVLSGTAPGTAGTHFFWVQATDSLGNFGVRAFWLNVATLRFSTSSTLPWGNVNTAYSTTLAVTGATGTVTYALKAGHALPPGLSLNCATGVISGPPSAAGNYFFDIIATDSGTGGTVTRSFTLLIYPPGTIPPLYISTPSDLGASAIGQVQVALIAGGGTGSYTWSVVGSLPPGLAGLALRTDIPSWFSSGASAGIMGVATLAGPYNFTLQVTSGLQTVSQAFKIKIHTLLMKDVNLPDAFANVAYSYTFSNTGIEPVTWSVQAGTTLPPGLTLNSSTGELSGPPTTAATYTVSVSMSDGVNTNSRSFQLNVWAVRITTAGLLLPNATQNAAYSAVTFAAEGGTPPYTWSQADSIPGGMTFTADGVLSGTPTGSGTWRFRVTATDSQARFYTKRVSLTVVGAPPILPRITTSANLDDFSLGGWSSRQFDVTGGAAPYTWSVANAPPGLSLRYGTAVSSSCPPSSAELWGTPTQLGTWNNVIVTVTDGSSPSNSTSQTYTVRVVALDFPRNDNIPNGTRGQPYSAYVRILGGTLPYTWEIIIPGDGKLPAGLSLNPNTGMVTGTPLENSNPSAQFRITDNGALTFIRSFNFNIGGGTSTIRIDTDWDLGSTTQSPSSYSRTLTACCVPSPYLWSVEPGPTLPPGLSLDPNTGVLSGTPTQTSPNPPKYYSFLIRAFDSTNPANYGVKEFRLNVTPVTVTSSTTLPWTNQGGSYSSTITYSGNSGAVTFGLALGSLLPPNLTLSPTTGVISGALTYAGAYNFNLTLTDAAGNTRTVGFNISIYAPGATPPLFFSLGPALGPGMVGRTAYGLTATGGVPPYTYSYAPSATPVPGMRVQTGAPLPSGWTSTGGFMGVVTTPGVYTTTIRVTDSKSPTPQTFDRPITLTVSPLAILSQTNLPRVVVGSSYAYTFTVTGGTGPYTWSAPNPSNLPPGLTLNSSGLLSGIASSAGTRSFDVTVTDLSTSNSITVNHSLQVTAFAITTPGVLPQGTVNAAYSQQLTASVPVVSWRIQSRNLPGGLSLDSATGLISGTPTGTFYDYFTVQATDGSNQIVRKVFSLMIAASPPQSLAIWTGSALSDTPLGGTYTTTLTAFGGTPPYTWTLEALSTLPPGLSLAGPGETVFQDGAPGFTYIAGRVTTVGSYTFTLRVTDSAASFLTRAFTLNVTPVLIDYSDLPLSGTTLIYNTPYTQPLLGLGGSGTYTWAAEGPMPTGLALSAAGTASGTPTSTGTFGVSIRITDGSATYLRNVNFTISSGTARTLTLSSGPDLGTRSQGSLYSTAINPSGSALSTPNYTFSVIGPLPPGCVLQTGNAVPSGVATTSANLACTPFSTGTFTFAVRVQDADSNFGVRTYTLRVTPDTIFTGGSNLANASVGVAYSQTLLAWGPSQNWTVNYKSALPPNMNLSSSGLLTGSPTTPGDYSFGLDLTDGSGLTVSRTFSLHVSTINITDPGLLPVHAISSTPFTYTFTATGGGLSKTWTRTSGSFPTGITLDPATGVLSGTTASTGNYSFVLSVSDGSPTFSKRFTLVVRDPYPAVLTFPLASTQLGDAAVGQSYSAQIVPSGGVAPYAWTVASGSLPPGLALYSGAALPANYNPHVTLLAGAPTTASVYSFTLQATDAAGNTIQRTFNLNVKAFNIPSVGLRNPVYGTAYAQGVTAIGGTAPYSYSLISGLLPDGLTPSLSGLISGTPANTGYWTFSVQATDSLGATFVRSFTILGTATTARTIDITNSAAQSDRSVGVRLNTVLTAQTVDPATGFTSDTGPYTWSLFSGTLPPGLSLVPGASLSPTDFPANSTVLAGSPTTPGLYTFTLRATDSTLPTPNYGLKTFTLRVSPMQVWTAPWPDVRAGVPFSYSLIPAGGTLPHTFVLAPFNYLPAGVTLSPGGVLSGSTSLTGSFSFSFIVREAGGATFTISATIRVLPAGKNAPLRLTSEDGRTFGGGFTDPSVGVNYISRSVLDVAASSGAPPLTWSLVSGSLPPGMVLIPGDSLVSGNLTGVPTTAGPYSFSLRATDSAGQSLTGAYNTTVSGVGFAPYPLPPAIVGTPYSVTVTPWGGTAPYSVQLRYNSSLPPGISLSSGVLSGTPTAPGRFSGFLVLTDSLGAVLTKAYYLYVDSAVTPVAFLALSPGSLQLTYPQGETPPAATINISSGSTPVSFTAGVSGIPGASLSVISGTTPRTTTLLLPNLLVGTYYGVIQVNSSQSPNTPQTVPMMVTVATPPLCAYAVSPATATIASSGGSGMLTITTNRSACGWAATASQLWITFTSPISGTGSGSVSYSISSNPGTSPRTGTINLDGQTHTITQFGSQCAYTINPTSASLSAAGGAGVIAVNASLAECAWTATTADPWITFTSPPAGTGSGAVNIAVAANATGLVRAGTVTVATQTFTVSQAPAACIVSLSSGGADMSASGGSGSVGVNIPPGCSYTTVPGPNWITVLSGGSGTGPGTLNYSVAQNSSTQSRSGSLLIGGQHYQISQAGVPCSFSLTNDSPVFAFGGGSGSIGVAANGPNCDWNSTSSASWLKITSGLTGIGNGTVMFTVDPNALLTARSGSITVAGQSAPISQSGRVCSYSLRSSSGAVPASGSTGSVGVVTAAACSWTPTSNNPWLAITSGGVSGSGDAVFVASPNGSAAGRVGTLTVAEQTYTVTQPGAVCAYTLSQYSTTVAYTGATGSFTFSSTTEGCTPSAVSYSGWIQASTSFSGKSGTVTFTAAFNPSGSPRSGVIQLSDQIFTITQTASVCAFSLNAYGALFSSAGGGGQVLASPSALGCVPGVGSSPEITLGPLSGPVYNIWTQPYTVAPFNSFVTFIRLLYINISGQMFTVKQTSW